jgi:phosphohistidine phosphatase
MQVYLLRHGIAEDTRPGTNDSDRQLTAEGRRRLRETLHVAAAAEVKPTLILTSPLTRARQTAAIAADVLKYKGSVVETQVLIPNARPEHVWDEIRVHKDQGELMLVGHDPLFTTLSGHLLGVPELQIDFKKGAILRVDFESFGTHPRGVLRWFLTAKLAGNKAASGRRSKAHP